MRAMPVICATARLPRSWLRLRPNSAIRSSSRATGGRSAQTFFCVTRPATTQTAIETVFDKHSHLYDYVALAQEFIPTAHEYRLVCYRRTPVLAYARSGGPSTFNARYWESASARAVLIEQAALLDELAAFVRPVYGVLDLGFVGFDIVRAVDGRLYLLELNSGPRFDRVIATNGTRPVIAMYKTVLSAWVSEESSPRCSDKEK